MAHYRHYADKVNLAVAIVRRKKCYRSRNLIGQSAPLGLLDTWCARTAPDKIIPAEEVEEMLKSRAWVLPLFRQAAKCQRMAKRSWRERQCLDITALT